MKKGAAMNIFLSDLDNTLIYSHRHRLSGKKRVSEYLDGREQSYITEKTLLLLRTFCSIEGNVLVPLTTRTFKQYSRLRPLTELLGIRYALISNGAVLLENGRPDTSWEEESKRLAEPYSDRLIRCRDIISRFTDESHVHYIEPYMVYCRPADAEKTLTALKSELDTTGLSVIFSSGKLYCLPECLSKGEAAKRLIKRIGGQEARVISAGDSEFDIPMLRESDISFVPEKMKRLPDDLEGCIKISGIFSNGLCESLIRLPQREK